MKKIFNKSAHLLIIILAHLLINTSIFAQAPQKMSYQAVIRNTSGALVSSSSVGIQISILQGTATGTAVYTETQNASTNVNGMVSLEIGVGTVITGIFAGINWANGPYFIKTETDPAGGTNYSITGTNELMSVPYALFSANGTPGPAGPQGAQGIQGLTGATGPQGIAGTNGNDGATGPQGIAGTNGNDGATGATGLTGATGPTGAAGQGGVTTAGTGINVTGAGTVASPYVVSTTSPCGLAIGQTYQGGIIYYLDASGCHGLISAPTNQSTGIQWWNGSYIDTYASGSGLFDGDGNCYRIRRAQGDCASCNAAEICLDLTLGVYSDWYLPSKYELNLMYLNIGQGNALGLGNVGGFASDFYWSSTEYDNDYAWVFYFSNGDANYLGSKFYAGFVRAVRAF